jgi:tetratricopeptide (TPR) repeat protein
MYDIEQLEAQWRRYRRKRIALPVAVAALIIAGIGGYRIWRASDAAPEPTPAPEVAAATHKENSTVKPAAANRTSPRTGGWKMTFNDDASAPHEASTSPTKKIAIEVTPRKSERTVSAIEKRFRFAKDKDDALFLARYYYDKKKYKKAMYWALETNKLDSDIEESWLIFARAKAHLGERTEAIRVLQAYVDRSGSAKARVLLDKIRRGKAF